VQEIDRVGADGGVTAHDARATLEMLRQEQAHKIGLRRRATEKEVVCQSCGGRTAFSGSLTATRCPYCATPIQRNDVQDAVARLPVDGVIPFKVTQDEANARLQKWVRRRLFAPKEFKQFSRAGSFTSLYATYFVFDAEGTTEYNGRRGDDHEVKTGSGDDERTEIRTEWREVSGTINLKFDNLAVLANTGLDEKHTTKLEPWPFETAQPYSPEFVVGHMCRAYDGEFQDWYDKGTDRMHEAIQSGVEIAIGGDHQEDVSFSTDWKRLDFRHLLLPIWLLTVLFGGKVFQVFINGVTGEVKGQRPYDVRKIVITVAAVVLVVAALVVWASLTDSGGGTGP
jgi:hypothetical protein